MRAHILKIVVVLLLSGSGEARPRKIEESRLLESPNTNPEEWRPSSVPRTVREDSRYTWSSGSTSIPYTNYYRGTIVPFVEHVDGSVDRPGISKSTDVERSNNLNHFSNSSRPIVDSRRSGNSVIDALTNSDRQIVRNTREQVGIKTNNNLIRRENSRRRYIVGDYSRKNATNSSDRRANPKFDSGYTRVRLLDSRISSQRKTVKRNPTRNHLSKNSANVHEPFRISNRILLNNSLTDRVASNQSSEFSNRVEEFQSPVDVVSAKVESTTPFDHVKAIKKITSMLTQKQFPSESPMESKNRIDLKVPAILPLPAHFNRRVPTKSSNGTKPRRPVVQQSNSNKKKHQNKIQSNKINRDKGNSTDPNMSLKNWPNGAIQNADDFHNYNTYTSMEDDTNQEVTIRKPFPVKNSNVTYHVPMSSSNIQEIINWLKIPAFMTNGSHFVQSEQVEGPINVAFDPIYQNLEPNKPARPSNVQSPKPELVYPYHSSGYSTEKIPNRLPDSSLRNKTQYPHIYSPQTQVSQNTVVHLITTDSRKSNRTKVPIAAVTSAAHSPSASSSSLQTSGAGSYPPSLILSQLYPSSSSTPKPGPNVHIGFTSHEENDKVSDERVPQAPLVTYDHRCPTIVINSYTRINNTIQSKEGCTDLNIIINSHLFNTNVYKTTSSPLTDQTDHESYQTYGETDKYGTEVDSAFDSQSVPTYQPSYSDFSSWPQNGYYDAQKHPQSQTNQQDDISNVHVIHDTQISISNSAAADEIPPVEIAPVEAEEPESLGDGGDSPTVSDAEIVPTDDSSLVRPAAGQASSDVPSPGDSLSSQAALATSPPSNRPFTDDDDDDYDLSPGGIMESIASVFTYFTFVNPLHYGFFSLAAAPFTALAAGVLGIVTFLYPWVFPSSFGFSRANHDDVDNFLLNLEEVVRHSLEKYGRVNEWKSKRKKRKRIKPNETLRDLKDLQYMDQSVRTVATQLLNVSSPEEPPKILDNVIKKPSISQKPIAANQIKEVTANNGQTVGVGFRPINSMFNYFESSHPGHAMAITEEELEKEMSSTRLMSAHKVHPTTTGGISTWILLNPPSTTMKTSETEKNAKQPVESEAKGTTKSSTVLERVDTAERIMEEATVPVTTTVIMEESPTTKNSNTVTTKKTTESKPDKVPGPEKVESVQTSTTKTSQTVASSTESNEDVPTTTKKVHVVRTTPKSKITNTKTTVLSHNSSSKSPRPSQPNRPKVSIRRTTVKPSIAKNETSTAKIEKVTFRPVQMITIPKGKVETTVKPMFVTKIKASILMDTQKATTQLPVTSTTSLPLTTTSKTTTPSKASTDVSAKPKPIGTKVNNVLKVQLKKPLDDSTKIEIEPIKVNAPVLKIEKVDKEASKEKEKVEKVTESLDNTRIDLMQFDFNPELTKINVGTEAKEVSSSSTTTEPSTTSTTTSSSTTKRPRSNSKRKKNKGRRRKPSTSTSTTTTTMISSTVSSSTESETSVGESIVENGIQESKIVPESKVGNNLTKIKKKPGTTPISMQIYNFLSREVMPSFGVMSLVGLGLGLASYFLYPFGGTVTRRNYDLEPKYKYNFDEYGGNYGQREEEVLSKVLQGMTTDETKYPASKIYDNNYYHYQHYDGAYEPQSMKKDDTRNPPSSPIYRPETSNSVLKLKNTVNRYPSDSPSTTKYYDRSKPSEYVVEQTVPGSVNRQFVVGSVPKGYPSPYEKESPALSTPTKLANSYKPTESGQLQLDHNANQNFNFPVGSVQSYGQVQTARPEESYDEVEITPTAVAVEHGPRALKTKRSSLDLGGVSLAKAHRSRRKRDSVIQVIPSKRELEEEEKEEDLSNEILNIIDSALPGDENYDDTKKQKKKDDEANKLGNQRRKDKEEEQNAHAKESTTEDHSVEANTIVHSSDSSSTTSSTTTKVSESSTVPSSSVEPDLEEATTSSSKTTEQSTVDWADTTTKKPAEQNGFNFFNFVKKIAEIKFRLGLTLLKHASEGFARYIGNVQKRINGEE